MKIELFTICDGAYNYNGKLTIVGTADTISLADLPGTATFGFAIKMLIEPGDFGKRNMSIELFDPSGEKNPFEIRTELDIKSSDDISRICMAGNINSLPLGKEGAYKIRVCVENLVQCDYPISVMKAKKS